MILIFNNRLYNEQVNPRKNINIYFIAVKRKTICSWKSKLLNVIIKYL